MDFVNGKDCPIYDGKKMFETTNQPKKWSNSSNLAQMLINFEINDRYVSSFWGVTRYVFGGCTEWDNEIAIQPLSTQYDI